jgi:hypothetical protein
MASTRNKNTTGNFVAERSINNNTVDYFTNNSYSFGTPLTTYYPGDGLLHGRVASENLAHNNIDIETQLFGIGSTNLVKPKINQYPELKPIQSLSIIDRIPIIIPEPLIIHKDQRPFPLN